MKKQTLLSQKEYAAHLGVSQQAVNRMVRTGKVPSTHGRIDPVAADLALAPIDAEKSSNSISEALRRKEWALAGLREHELARKNGEVVDVAYVERCQTQVNSNIKQRLLGLPSKLTPRLVGIGSPAKIKTILEREIHETLEELSRIAVPD
jgi:hypothetical protein